MPRKKIIIIDEDGLRKTVVRKKRTQKHARKKRRAQHREGRGVNANPEYRESFKKENRLMKRLIFALAVFVFLCLVGWVVMR